MIGDQVAGLLFLAANAVGLGLVGEIAHQEVTAAAGIERADEETFEDVPAEEPLVRACRCGERTAL
ncbi:hypothetical protein [Streptomyces sp. NBC_00207]|uniref:hypothetical protein n=1 Tax=unclassified Streptomyces TaxID=2593676 RepID=UPI002883D533|nr:hypothetical protein [Streptomyces sp. DSM 41633]